LLETIERRLGPLQQLAHRLLDRVRQRVLRLPNLALGHELVRLAAGEDAS